MVTGLLPEIRIRSQEPAWFRVGKWMQSRKLGGFKIVRIGSNLFWPSSTGVQHSLTPEIQLTVPIGIRPFGQFEVMSYEDSMIQFVSDLVGNTTNPVTLIDCGADFGLVSARLLACNPKITKILAFEPNADAFPFLAHNTELWPVEATAYPFAVADYVGQGEFNTPSFDKSAHAAFVTPSSSGALNVVTIDSLGIEPPGTALLKIDVEGAEQSVVKGAQQLLSSATDVVVIFEAHPGQETRVGIDPVEIVKMIQGIKPCRAMVTERPDLTVETNRPFREQVGDDEIYNICVTSLAA